MDYRRTAGFSLIELLVAVAIGAALLSAAIPRLEPVLQGAALRSEARILAGTVEELSMSAQLRGERISLLVRETGFEALRLDTDGQVFLKRKFRPGTVVSQVREILFSPSGAVSPASITISEGKMRCDLKVALRGRVTMIC